MLKVGSLIFLYVLIVQRIEPRFPKPLIPVRVWVRAPLVMRKTILLLCSVLILAGCQHSSSKMRHPISIVSVAMTTRSEDSFKGILESFQHKESKGSRVFLRTNPENRSGVYFTVKFNHSVGLLPQGAKIVLHYITNTNPVAESATWTFPEVKHSLWSCNELHLGITDDTHYAEKNQLIAWQLEILHPDGHVIAHEESLAW